jgi:MFS family permease
VGADEAVFKRELFSGLLADRYGRLRVVVTLIVAYLLTGLAGGLTTSLHLWLVLRFLMGAASIGMHTVRYTLQVLNTSLILSATPSRY